MNYRTCHLRESATTPSRACGHHLDPIGESAAFRLGLMLGAGGMAIAVMALFAVFVHA